jgi:tetratricopeptide (TPR) repeat protein
MKGRCCWPGLALIALLLGSSLFPAQGQEQPPEEPANFLARVNQLYQAGKYAEAIPIAEHYAKAIEVRNGTETPEYALALNELAYGLQATNRLSEAELMFKRALAVREKVLPEGDVAIATSLNNLASLYRAQGRLTEAEPLLKRALEMREKALPAGIPALHKA